MSGTRLADEDKPIQTREKTMEMDNKSFIEFMLENSEPEAIIPELRVEGVEGVVHEQQIHKMDSNGWVQYCVFTTLSVDKGTALEHRRLFNGAFDSFQDALEKAISPQRSLIKSLYKQKEAMESEYIDAQYTEHRMKIEQASKAPLKYHSSAHDSFKTMREGKNKN